MSDNLRNQIKEITANLIVQEKFNMQTISLPLGTKFNVTYRTNDNKVESKIFHIGNIELRDRANYYLFNKSITCSDRKKRVVIYNDVYFIELTDLISKVLKIEKLTDHI